MFVRWDRIWTERTRVSARELPADLHSASCQELKPGDTKHTKQSETVRDRNIWASSAWLTSFAVYLINDVDQSVGRSYVWCGDGRSSNSCFLSEQTYPLKSEHHRQDVTGQVLCYRRGNYTRILFWYQLVMFPFKMSLFHCSASGVTAALVVSAVFITALPLVLINSPAKLPVDQISWCRTKEKLRLNQRKWKFANSLNLSISSLIIPLWLKMIIDGGEWSGVDTPHWSLKQEVLSWGARSERKCC